MICEAFGCTPGQALREDWQDIRAILDYRALQAAKEAHNSDVTKLTEHQVELWKEMLDASGG